MAAAVTMVASDVSTQAARGSKRTQSTAWCSMLNFGLNLKAVRKPKKGGGKANEMTDISSAGELEQAGNHLWKDVQAADLLLKLFTARETAHGISGTELTMASGNAQTHPNQ